MSLLDRLLGRKTDATPAAKPAPDPPAPESPESEEEWQDEAVPQELQAAEVRARLEQDPKPVLLDIREHPELDADGFIPGSVHIPMTEIETRVDELDMETPHIVYCKSGMRSFDVGFFLIQNGCREVINLNGGIKAWDGEIERR